MTDYSFLRETLTGKHWKRLGTDRRAGVAVPLFSVYSEKSAGIGEIPDICLLVDWCKAAGMSMLQLLPLNDVGFRYTPYDAESTFALEPAYLRLEGLEGVPDASLKEHAEKLKADFPVTVNRVNYGIKKAKLDILRRLFDTLETEKHQGFQNFIKANHFWIKDYALFKALKETQCQKEWEAWEPELRNRIPRALSAFETDHRPKILFYQWLQYQLFCQFDKARQYARNEGVFLMGDLPFLVSRDSADVWANPSYFKLDLASGAPPDLYFAQGQRWGMPPYSWETIAQKGYDYLLEKLRWAQHFYDLYRIDHVVGIFRVWTLQLSEPLENYGYNGRFDPEDPSLWEEQGRRLLSLMIQSSDMLPCAEDLGVVPDCAVKVLGEFGIPGMDVQRWRRDWENSYRFLEPEAYRPVSIALTSTHDMDSFKNWWDQEVGTIDEERFKRGCQENGLVFEDLKARLFEPSGTAGRLRWKRSLTSLEKLLEEARVSSEKASFFASYYRASFTERAQFLEYLGEAAPKGQRCDLSTPELVQSVLLRVNQAKSIFAIQMFSDLLSIMPDIHDHAAQLKINWPGTFGEHNWSARMPLSLETLVKDPLNAVLRDIHRSTGRI